MSGTETEGVVNRQRTLVVIDGAEPPCLDTPRELEFESLIVGIRPHDPDIGHPVKVAEHNGQYRMLFQARDNTAIRVEVHIRVAGNHTGLHFYEVGNKNLGEPARAHYRKLKQRLVLEFGADNVTDNHPLLAP